MTSLEKFPKLPSIGKITLCEVEGKIHSLDAEGANVEKFTSAVSVLINTLETGIS